MANGDHILTEVPEEKVGDIVQQYIEWDGATEVRCEKMSDGTWTLVAH